MRIKKKIYKFQSENLFDESYFLTQQCERTTEKERLLEGEKLAPWRRNTSWSDGATWVSSGCHRNPRTETTPCLRFHWRETHKRTGIVEASPKLPRVLNRAGLNAAQLGFCGTAMAGLNSSFLMPHFFFIYLFTFWLTLSSLEWLGKSWRVQQQ